MERATAERWQKDDNDREVAEKKDDKREERGKTMVTERWQETKTKRERREERQ